MAVLTHLAGLSAIAKHSLIRRQLSCQMAVTARGYGRDERLLGGTFATRARYRALS